MLLIFLGLFLGAFSQLITVPGVLNATTAAVTGSISTTTITPGLIEPTTPVTLPPTTVPHSDGRFAYKIGMMVTETQQKQIGFSLTGGAITLALQRIRDLHLLDNVDFTFVVKYTDCTEPDGAGKAVDLLQNEEVDVILGPACANAIIPSAYLSSFYQKLQVVWGFASNYALSDGTRFPSISTIVPNYRQLGYSLITAMQSYKWDIVALLYGNQNNNVCENMMSDVSATINDPLVNVTLAATIKIDLGATTSAASARPAMVSALRKLATRARIIAVCMPDDDTRRNFILATAEAGMNTNDYVFVILSVRGYGLGQQNRVAGTAISDTYTPIWIDTMNQPADGLNAVAQEAAKRFFSIDLSNAGTIAGRTTADVTDEVLAGVRGAPFYCNTTACLNNSPNTTGAQIGSFAPQLYDGFMYYAYCLNLTMGLDPVNGIRNRTLFDQVRTSVSFSGWSGMIAMTPNATRIPRFYLYGVAGDGTMTRFMNFTWRGDGDYMLATPLYIEEAASIWASRGGVRPLSTPICGFKGDDCPLTTWQQSGLFICIGVGVGILLCILTIILCLFISREKRKDMARQDAEWQIAFLDLHRPNGKGSDTEKSQYSLHSSKSSNSKFSKASGKTETDDTAYFLYRNEPIMAYKYKTTPRLSTADFAEFRQLRKLENDNIHRFIGIVHDHIPTMSVWKFASRGTLEEVIHKGTMTLDAFFAMALIKDLSQGLKYIHSSFLGVHGNLNSSTCWIDERWQLKVSGYGCRTLLKGEQPEKRKQLWWAPELLRSSLIEPTKESDIYAFAIICSEIVTRKTAFDLENRDEKVEELLYSIRRVSHLPTRPDLVIPEEMELNPALLHLIRDCWDENPHKRPDISTICSVLKSMSSANGGQQNLMDHVFQIMESYAETLEKEVENRMAELVEEKKKSDLLLYRMLPRQVADKLKLGQSVEPESFDVVTIFFSDVVQFTNLAAKCTPLQIVTLLNELYTTFDTVIEKHQVYKVETIGDGYLCVSGLPKRNGNQHVKDIAEMSLDFFKEVQMFRVPHLPNQTVNLRIGMHSGSCVAGVVGLAMPRYCLFGDTVNTASRMESNGKPGKIHMSSDAAALLSRIGGYEMEPRGEVMIKGKGVMETFWLEGRIGGQSRIERPPAEMRNRPASGSRFLEPRQGRQSSGVNADVPPSYEGVYKNF